MLKHDARILIADDSRMARLALSRMLAALGYRNVIEASDGTEAIDLHARDNPDLILLDVVMPKLRGDQVLATIRATDRGTPVIMLSSVAKQSEIDACRRLGITDYLIKPLVADAGAAVLREQLERL